MDKHILKELLIVMLRVILIHVETYLLLQLYIGNCFVTSNSKKQLVSHIK